MQSKTDTSYGIIPVIKIDDEWHVFLIHQSSRIGGNTFWGFPKGHAESGEQPLEAAARELTEETNIVLMTVDTDHPMKTKYEFTSIDGTKIDKSATYWLGFAASFAYTLQPEEIVEAGWFPLVLAQKQVTYDSAREILNLVHERLRNC